MILGIWQAKYILKYLVRVAIEICRLGKNLRIYKIALRVFSSQ